jgi:hypothetical protein
MAVRNSGVDAMGLTCKMEFGDGFDRFISSMADDPRVSPFHISLMVAILFWWKQREYKNPVQVFSKDLKPLARIFSSSTFHRTLKELHAFGYIRYEPSNDPYRGSLIYIAGTVTKCEYGKCAERERAGHGSGIRMDSN